MGNHKQKWTAEEEEALKAGVKKHGMGKWKTILVDPEFATPLTHRSNIDLKDKWRNLGISSGAAVQVSKDKSPVLSITNGSAAIPIAQNAVGVQNAIAVQSAITAQNTTTAQNANNALALVDANGISNSPRTPANAVTIPTKRYYSLIFDAISSTKDPRGADFNTIATIIEQKNEVPHNFRRALSSLVRRLTMQKKLEKVDQRFKIKNSGSRIPTPRQRDAKPGTSRKSQLLDPATLEGAVSIASDRLADAEHKAWVAAEAVKESEDIADLAEEAEIMLEIVKGIWEQSHL
ncbi:MYB transcription factor [Heracleum sosnowskyi]|uniref:MYB transcription factor n=1 Tax=Heracleum sosnowskyi TaxID=360622 RepID=A0AAD8HAH1_9APIA|nr:MYB transcription factor [Heracleum sosnowskyi]